MDITPNIKLMLIEARSHLGFIRALQDYSRDGLSADLTDEALATLRELADVVESLRK